MVTPVSDKIVYWAESVADADLFPAGSAVAVVDPVSEATYTAFFIDDFTRSDGDTVGNDWTSNYPNTHGISTNRLRLDCDDISPDTQYLMLHLARPAADQVKDQGYEFIIPSDVSGNIIYGVAARWQASDTVATETAADNTYMLIGVRKQSSTSVRIEFYDVEAGVVGSIATQLDHTVPSGSDLLIRVSVTGDTPTDIALRVFDNATHELLAEETVTASDGPQVAGRFALITWGASSATGTIHTPAVRLHNLETPLKVALLGDSVTIGTPYTTEEHTWRAKLSREFGYEVTSYAVSGADITVACPDDYVKPSSTWDDPDPTKNVTKAIADGADIVIVSFVSNFTKNADGLGQTGVDNYMDAAIAIRDACVAAGVDYWFFETAPRDGTQQLRDTLHDTADAITAEFGDRALAVYDTLATETRELEAIYDSGDELHPNAAGHNVFYEKISEALSPTNIKWIA